MFKVVIFIALRRCYTFMTITDMMTKELETIEELSSIRDAAKRIRDTSVSSLVVVDSEGKPRGIVTERDIVRKACVNDVSTSKVTNKEIMSSRLITIDPHRLQLI